jgi:hypothetical protein
MVTGETDDMVEWYRPRRAVGIIYRNVKIQGTGSLLQAARLALNEAIPGVSFEDNSATGSSDGHRLSPSILPTLLNRDFLSRAAHAPINQGAGLLAARGLSPPFPLLCIQQSAEACSYLINLMVGHGVEQR